MQVDREKQHKKYSIYDYPACLVACCTIDNPLEIDVSKSSRPIIGKTYKTPILLKALMSLGAIGKKSGVTKCKYPIGQCAEQHAAELVLNKHFKSSLASLRFSKAIRPRTKAVMGYCDNCKYIFKL